MLQETPPVPLPPSLRYLTSSPSQSLPAPHRIQTKPAMALSSKLSRLHLQSSSHSESGYGKKKKSLKLAGFCLFFNRKLSFPGWPLGWDDHTHPFASLSLPPIRLPAKTLFEVRRSRLEGFYRNYWKFSFLVSFVRSCQEATQSHSHPGPASDPGPAREGTQWGAPPRMGSTRSSPGGEQSRTLPAPTAAGRKRPQGVVDKVRGNTLKGFKKSVWEEEYMRLIG